ncbi:MAG: HAMP domain-containing histidine kinase, partial [Campylobacterales bacterium]|nr:HAMP domain-containing histidine kinase [Campylobacterales bacterium]
NSIDAYNEKNIDNREIFISAKLQDDMVIIKVEDNAGGIDKEILDHIFEPNFTTKPEGKGSGVGLYIASKIIKKDGGSIKADTTNSGAIFTITLNQPLI